ncbi:hypothetical protein B9Z55_000920 [Caenorhabditis nigoni]|uniref:Uncharacterized protein n=2 Tax=Caenorhabditis nigoni TaxID=1611254 RepID=A0A2G5VVH1_9PELO|nr:hypothetical protein B9Z55_000919 [Caenorhabditis nigoni]PIC55796.1 hypothetical protein B9Z55_000920 [Caenorhabditis nigoni]
MTASLGSIVCDDNMVGGAFPTKEDLDFFDKFAEIVDGAELSRMTPNVLVMAPKKIAFKNLQHLPKTTNLDKNIGRLFDIFIRRMIQAAGGDLENTCYWLNLRHLDHHGTDGYWIRHKTYKMANGHKIIELIGKNWQSENNNIPKVGLDQTMILSMKVFTKEGLDQTPVMKVFAGAPRCDENCSMNTITQEMDETNMLLDVVGLESIL